MGKIQNAPTMLLRKIGFGSLVENNRVLWGKVLISDVGRVSRKYALVATTPLIIWILINLHKMFFASGPLAQETIDAFLNFLLAIFALPGILLLWAPAGRFRGWVLIVFAIATFGGNTIWLAKNEGDLAFYGEASGQLIILAQAQLLFLGLAEVKFGGAADGGAADGGAADGGAADAKSKIKKIAACLTLTFLAGVFTSYFFNKTVKTNSLDQFTPSRRSIKD